MQPDTLIPDYTNPQAWNRYSYVGNNPANFNDPTGHDADCGLGDGYCNESKHEYHDSWKGAHPNSDFKNFMKAKDAYHFYNNHLDIALKDLLEDDGKATSTYGQVDSYTLASMYSEDVRHQLFNPVPDDFVMREIDMLNALKESGAYVDPNYFYALAFGLFVVMGPDGGGGGGDIFSSSGIRTTAHFWDGLSEYGISEKTAFNTYMNGTRYTNNRGQFMIWDAKTKIAIRVDNFDYGAITVWEQAQVPGTWKKGWLDPFGQ